MIGNIGIDPQLGTLLDIYEGIDLNAAQNDFQRLGSFDNLLDYYSSHPYPKISIPVLNYIPRNINYKKYDTTVTEEYKFILDFILFLF
jgi:hypothetical protein